MCKTNGWNGEEKSWFEIVNNIGRDIEVHARGEYDTFLEKCLEPWGITKENAYRFEGRVRMEEENQHINGFEMASYQRFYIDGAYAFTVVMTRAFEATSNGYNLSSRATYDKVVEQDQVPKEKNMTNKKAIDILETVRGMSASKEEDEAFDKAIAALEEQDKYRWIFTDVNETEWDSLFEKVEKALGFKLFYWQKTYILGMDWRRSGKTTAIILQELLKTEATPIDYSRPASSHRCKILRTDLLRIKEKLDKAGIKTREVWRCKADRDAWTAKRVASVPASAGIALPPNAIRNCYGLPDKED